jgi:large subunit ribosomal protein L28
MNICVVCGKAPMSGQNIRNTHSIGWRYRAPRTKRVFKPNLVSVKTNTNGTARRVKVCAKCLKANKVTRAA